MNRYCISYISFFDYNMQMMVVEADNEIEALYKGYNYFVGDDDIPKNITDKEEFFDEVFNQDAKIGVLQI